MVAAPNESLLHVTIHYWRHRVGYFNGSINWCVLTPSEH